MACADYILQSVLLRHCHLLNLPVEKQNGPLWGDQSIPQVLQRIRANFQSMTSSSILYPFYFAIAAWLYSSIVVLFLSDSVPELYNLFMTKCMWFTLLSGISLMCSRTPIVKSIAGLQAVVWSSQSVAEVVLLPEGLINFFFIVSRPEKGLSFRSDDIKVWTKPFSSAGCRAPFFVSDIL